jgi:hypothetical protein
MANVPLAPLPVGTHNLLSVLCSILLPLNSANSIRRTITASSAAVEEMTHFVSSSCKRQVGTCQNVPGYMSLLDYIMQRHSATISGIQLPVKQRYNSVPRVMKDLTKFIPAQLIFIIQFMVLNRIVILWNLRLLQSGRRLSQFGRNIPPLCFNYINLTHWGYSGVLMQSVGRRLPDYTISHFKLE